MMLLFVVNLLASIALGENSVTRPKSTCYCRGGATYKCYYGHKWFPTGAKVQNIGGHWETACGACAREARDDYVNSPPGEAEIGIGLSTGYSYSKCFYCTKDWLGIYLHMGSGNGALSGTKFCGTPKADKGRYLEEAERFEYEYQPSRYDERSYETSRMESPFDRFVARSQMNERFA